MQIRTSTGADYPQLDKLFKDGARCGERFASWYANRCRPLSEGLAAEENGKIMSMLEYTSYEIMINSVPARAVYISAAATASEHRGKGLMRGLVTKALSDMYENDIFLCLAVPSSYRMFNKFGFRLTHRFQQYSLKTEEIPDYSVKGSVGTVDIDENIIGILSEIYGKYTGDKNAYVIRSPRDWDIILDDLKNNFGGHIALARSVYGIPLGYMLYTLGGGVMNVYETAYIDHSAYAAMMGFIRSHAPMTDKVVMKVPPDDLSFLDFCDSRGAAGMYPFAVSRIVNVQRALSFAAEAVGFSSSCTFKVVDMTERRNSGVFRVDGTEAAALEDGGNGGIDIMCDIGTLTQLFTGFISPAEAKKMCLISGDTDKAEALFPKRNNFINMLIV